MSRAKRTIVTGGAAFIGSALVRHLIANTTHEVLVYDKLTYAGTLTSLEPISGDPRFYFLQADICDAGAVTKAFAEFDPDVIVHLAAESHVDRSIDGPGAFIETNIIGTYVLLEAARAHHERLNSHRRGTFRFHHVSTDEVFGSLGAEGVFTEKTPYDPRSPYSASKAGSDHLVRAWHHTYGLPVTVTNCFNNYGPCHFPEKMIPLMIVKALAGEPLPVYGQGENVRDWLYVEDHVRAITTVFEYASSGATYNVGGHSEQRNIDVVETLCAILDRLRPRESGHYRDLISFVTDRPGHDFRFAIVSTRLEADLDWHLQESFSSGFEKTVRWYLENERWWRPLLERNNSGQRLGLKA